MPSTYIPAILPYAEGGGGTMGSSLGGLQPIADGGDAAGVEDVVAASPGEGVSSLPWRR